MHEGMQCDGGICGRCSHLANACEAAGNGFVAVSVTSGGGAATLPSGFN